MKITSALLTCLLALSPLASHAHCALEATAGAPLIPKPGQLELSAVMDLGKQVRTYIESASRKLAQCETGADRFVHNAAVAELEEIARRYNALVDSFNRDLATIN